MYYYYIVIILFFNFSYPLRCLRVPPRVRVPQVEYQWIRARPLPFKSLSTLKALLNNPQFPARVSTFWARSRGRAIGTHALPLPWVGEGRPAGA
jgi:hypothetical protein